MSLLPEALPGAGGGALLPELSMVYSLYLCTTNAVSQATAALVDYSVVYLRP